VKKATNEMKNTNTDILQETVNLLSNVVNRLVEVSYEAEEFKHEIAVLEGSLESISDTFYEPTPESSVDFWKDEHKKVHSDLVEAQKEIEKLRMELKLADIREKNYENAANEWQGVAHSLTRELEALKEAQKAVQQPPSAPPCFPGDTQDSWEYKYKMLSSHLPWCQKYGVWMGIVPPVCTCGAEFLPPSTISTTSSTRFIWPLECSGCGGNCYSCKQRISNAKLKTNEKED
jgi:hypothetical protein